MNEEWRYETAGDHGLRLRESMRSPLREPGLVGSLTTWIWWAGAGTWLRWRHRLTIRGRHRLPAVLPFLIVANHTSHLDALALGAAMRWRIRPRVFPLAAGDTFFETPATAALSAFALNALPMWRHNCGMHALENLRHRLISGRSAFILFPEGTRSRSGIMGHFKDGVGMLVAGTSVPVVPCHITGAFEAWPPQAKRPRGGRITVRIGRSRTFEHVENGRPGWKRIASDLEEAVAALGKRRPYE